MSVLRNKIIRLAHANPELRPHVLPLLKSGRDRIPGGLGDEALVTDFDPIQIQKGVDVEVEHTDDSGLALEIAMDHLTEDPAYYDKLEKMEAKGQRDLKKMSSEMSDNLCNNLIRLAHSKPELRELLLPILVEARGLPEDPPWWRHDAGRVLHYLGQQRRNKYVDIKELIKPLDPFTGHKSSVRSYTFTWLRDKGYIYTTPTDLPKGNWPGTVALTSKGVGEAKDIAQAVASGKKEPEPRHWRRRRNR